MAVQIAHAALDANWLDGKWASGPSMTSDRTVSMMRAREYQVVS